MTCGLSLVLVYDVTDVTAIILTQGTTIILIQGATASAQSLRKDRETNLKVISQHVFTKKNSCLVNLTAL